MIDLHLAFLIGLCYSWFHCYNNNGGFFNHWGFQFLIEETLSTSPSAAQWKKSSWSFLIKSLRIIQYHIYPRRSRQEHARNIGYSNLNLNESPILWNIYKAELKVCTECPISGTFTCLNRPEFRLKSLISVRTKAFGQRLYIAGSFLLRLLSRTISAAGSRPQF